jgi:hypothetical protein
VVPPHTSTTLRVLLLALALALTLALALAGGLRGAEGRTAAVDPAAVDPAAVDAAVEHPPRAGAADRPSRITLVGDSLTQQYGPTFQRLGARHGAVVGGRWFGGTNPVDHPWATWVREWSGVDYVVLQDAYVPDGSHTPSQYLAAWQTLVDAARTTLRPGGQVVVMNGDHPDLSSIRGIDRFVAQVRPDSPDGIHWTEVGSAAEARLLCRQLIRAGCS